MENKILFIQGGGDDGYEADAKLVASLQTKLGSGFIINYPELQSDESASDFGWIRQIGNCIAENNDEMILAGHSLGASMILKYLSENPLTKKVTGIFLLATPFWSGNEEWQKGLKLQENFAHKLPAEIPMFFYHCEDDEEVPFSHLSHYRQKLSFAKFRIMKTGGHQFNNDLTIMADDIRSLLSAGI